MGPYRVAVIGCGGRGKAHLKAFADSPRFEVVGLSDRQSAAITAAQEEASVTAPGFENFHELLAQLRPEVVACCLWTPMHLEVIEACIEAGVKVVLSEKPIAPTWGATLRIKDLAEASGTLVSFCHQRRFSAGNQLIRKMIRDGRLGTVQRLDLYSVPHLMDCGTHTFDQALSFIGEIEPKWVLAGADTSATVTYFDLPAEAMSVGQIGFEGGVRANFQNGGPDLDIWAGVRVYGDQGWAEADWEGNKIKAVVYDDPSFNFEQPSTTHEAQMKLMVNEVLDCYESGSESEVSLQKAFRAAQIIFAAYESIRVRKRIEIPFEGFVDHPLFPAL